MRGPSSLRPRVACNVAATLCRNCALLEHLHVTKQRLLRLVGVVGWAGKSRAVLELGRVLSVARGHCAALQQAADQLYYLNQDLQLAAVPIFDVATALELQQTGQSLSRGALA